MTTARRTETGPGIAPRPSADPDATETLEGAQRGADEFADVRAVIKRARYADTELGNRVRDLLAEVDRLTAAFAAAEGRLERVRALTLAWQHVAPVFYERVLAALDEGPR